MSTTTKKTIANEIVALIKADSISSLRKAKLVYILSTDHEMSPKDIAEKTELKVAQVYNLLQVSNWPVKVRNYVRRGDLTLSDALGLSRNQSSDNSFTKTVEKFVAMNVKQKTPTASILTALKKENPLQNLDKVSLKKLNFELGRLIFKITGKKPAVRKINEASFAVAAVL